MNEDTVFLRGRPRKLKNLRVTRVDLVDSGANFDPESGEGAHILLAKSANDGPPVGAAPEVVEKWHQDHASEVAARQKREYGRHLSYALDADADPYGDEDFGPAYRRALLKVSKTADPEDQLDALCKAFAEEYFLEPWTPAKKLSDATDIILRSPRGRELRAAIRAAKREQRRSPTFAERMGRNHEPDDLDQVLTAGGRTREREDMRPTEAELAEARALLRQKTTTGR